MGFDTNPADEDPHGECRQEIGRLKSYIAESLPFLEEAWAACFDGKQSKMLSAEERGMGRLLQQFKEIADGKPAVPFGLVRTKDAAKQVEQALEWAHRTLGQPNELREELREWMFAGDTCADGIERANAEVVRLRAACRKVVEVDDRCSDVTVENSHEFDFTAEFEKAADMCRAVLENV